jgi:hypothetical protein
MKVKVKVTFNQYVRLLYSLAYKKPVMKGLICVALLVILWIAFYYFHVLDIPKPKIYQYITLILIIVVQPIAIYTIIRRNYNSSNHLRETLDIDLASDDIKIRGESFYMEILWHKIFKIVETDNWFLIYQNNLSAIIIPKKNLPQTEIDDLRKNLKEKKLHIERYT